MKHPLKFPKRSLTLMPLIILMLLFSAFFSAASVSAAECTWTHRVRIGDTLSIIARNYETTLSDLLTLNPQISNANVIVDGADICISTTETPPPLYGTTYRVQVGDTLATLAQRFGATLSELARANGIGNINLIVEGETLTVPEEPVVVLPAS